MSNFELTVTRTIPAARQTVFDAWLSSEMLQKFMCPGEGMTCPKAEVDAKVGGNFLIVMTAGEKELPHRGEYKTIDRHDTIAFTWLSPYTVDDSLVKAMASYQHFLDETPQHAMAPEAMRRLADLQIEKEYGVIGEASTSVRSRSRKINR